MVDRMLKMTFKAVIVLAIARYLIIQLICLGLDPSMAMAVIFLLIPLVLVKGWFPSFFRFITGLIAGIFGLIAGLLWRRPERRGGANIRSTRMWWRS